MEPKALGRFPNARAERSSRALVSNQLLGGSHERLRNWATGNGGVVQVGSACTVKDEGVGGDFDAVAYSTCRADRARFLDQATLTW